MATQCLLHALDVQWECFLQGEDVLGLTHCYEHVCERFQGQFFYCFAVLELHVLDDNWKKRFNVGSE
jgi:hypothetical protein